MKPRVLVTRHVYRAALDRLAPHADVEYVDQREVLTEDELAARLADKDAVLCQLTDRITARVLDAAPRLRIVANIAVGYDNVDVAAATERGVLVSNTPGVLTETTADFTFALLLAAARRVVEADGFVRAGRWRCWEIDLLCGTDVHGKTLGIVGMGRIGRAVAARARGFGMRLLHANRRPVEVPGSTRVALDELLARADFVSLHVPAEPGAPPLIGARELALMQRTAILVNTARGAIVDEQALVDALRAGRIAGAALDVFAHEPHVPETLLGMPNVVLAPHLGSATVETRTRMATMAADNMVACLRGERPPNLVDERAFARRRP